MQEYESDDEEVKKDDAEIELHEKIVCPYYQKESGCWFGTKCRNLHPDEKDDKNEENDKRDMKRGNILCNFFMEGNCKFGENCRYSHDPTSEEIKQYREKKQKSGDDGSLKMERKVGEKLCVFFMNGKCTFGKKCRNSHEPTEEEKNEFQAKKDNKRHGERNGSKGTEEKGKANNKEKKFKADFNKSGKEKDEECVLGELVNDFKHLSKKMHFLGEKIQKISRYNTRKTSRNEHVGGKR